MTRMKRLATTTAILSIFSLTSAFPRCHRITYRVIRLHSDKNPAFGLIHRRNGRNTVNRFAVSDSQGSDLILENANEELCHQSEWNRRKIILYSFSTFLFSDRVLAESSGPGNDEPKECRNGGIVSESAVPGAYQQQCMDLAERTFLLESAGETITIEQGTSSSGVAGRTGVAVWNSGILLTRLLDRINQIDITILKGKTVVELGCGVGLASVAAAKLGASDVYATDANQEVLRLAQQNIERNKVSNVKTALLQWGLLDAFEFERAADIIIGSDLTYNPNTWRALAESMVTILKPGGCVIYLSLGHSGFNVVGELGGFTSVAENVGLQKNNNMLGMSLESIVPQMLSQEERSIIDASGGVRVLVLIKRKTV